MQLQTNAMRSQFWDQYDVGLRSVFSSNFEKDKRLLTNYVGAWLPGFSVKNITLYSSQLSFLSFLEISHGRL
jgi:hypothetical protein